MSLRLVLLASLALGLSLVTAPVSALQDRGRYQAAFWNLDTDARRRAARAWAEAEPETPDAVHAHALMTWQIDDQPDAALDLLETGLAHHPDDADLLHMKGRILAGQSDNDRAEAVLAQAWALAPENGDIGYALAAVQTARNQPDIAIETLRETLEHAPVHLDASLLLIDLAVEHRRYERVAPVWRALSVVGYTSADATGQSATDAWQALLGDDTAVGYAARGALLEHWHHYASAALEYDRAGDGERAALMRALVEYETTISTGVDLYYRERALGDDSVERRLAPRVLPPVNALSAALGLPPVSADTPEAMRDALTARVADFDERFRWLTLVGETNGRLDMHFGHIVSATPRPIDQWGESADIASITLFNMVSNGFSAWFWDEHAADGGWVTTGDDGRPESQRFIDVLDPKFGAAQSRAALLGDTTRQAEIRAGWDAALEENRSGYDRRVDQYLRLRALESVEAAVGAAANGETRRAVINAIVDHFVATSTVVHEGQHVLDTRYGYRGEQWLLEYRAKLTELAYGQFPLLSLDSFYAASSFTDRGATPHAQAEIALMRDLERELSDNSGAYPSLDPAAPPLHQLPSLTTDELRQVSRVLFERTQEEFTQLARR